MFHWITANLKANKELMGSNCWHFVQENRCIKVNALLVFLLCPTFKFWVSAGTSSHLIFFPCVELLYKFLQFFLNKQHKTDGVLSSTQQIMLGKIDVL